MRRLLATLFVFAFIYFCAALFLGTIDLRVVPPQLTRHHPESFYDYAGVINVHTARSSGSGSLDEVAAAANEALLDFVIVTDTNDFEPPLQREAYFDKTLVMVGGEYSYLDSRLLNIDFRKTDHLQGPGRTQILFSDLLSKPRSDDGMGMFILAHPLKPGYQWQGDIPQGITGVEIFNLRTIWQLAWNEKRGSVLWALFLYPLNIQWSFGRLFSSYSNPELPLWDQLTRERPMVGLVGADADARVRTPWDQTYDIPSYVTMFSVMRNHILTQSELTGNAQQDKRKIADAIENGRLYVSLDLLGDPTGFSAVVTDADQKPHLMGSQITYKPNLKLSVRLAERPTCAFEVVIIKDGQKIMTSNSTTTEMPLHGPGVYRVTVRLRVKFPFPDGRHWVPWILTNPFYIKGA